MHTTDPDAGFRSDRCHFSLPNLLNLPLFCCFQDRSAAGQIKRIKELFNSIENIIKAIESGQNVDLYNNRLTELRTELDQTEKTLKSEKSKIVVLTKDEIKFFLLQLRNGNTDNIKYRKILINIFVNKIYLYDDKIMIIFNVGKEPLTITVSLLEELEANLLCTNGSYLNKVGTPNFLDTNQYYFVGGFAVFVNLSSTLNSGSN